MQYVFFGVAMASLGAGILVWRAKLEPLRLYRGASGIRPDRNGFFLNAEWYRPEAAAWLRLVSILWIVAPLALLIAIVLASAA